jgi:hypothetical protein
MCSRFHHATLIVLMPASPLANKGTTALGGDHNPFDTSAGDAGPAAGVNGAETGMGPRDPRSAAGEAAVTEHPNVELARRGYDALPRETWLPCRS